MDIALDIPIFSETSPRAAHFFNGRLLTAEDLSHEQQANAEGRRQLGRALGDGIVRGFEVREASNSTAGEPVLGILAGLAVNRRGRAVELMNEVALPLTKPSATVTAQAAAGAGEVTFDVCAPTGDGVYILDNEGVYLLTVKPTEAREGRALVSGLNNGVAACNSKHHVAAVQFRLIALRDYLMTELAERASALVKDDGPASRSRTTHRLRNQVAHRCFGTGDPRLSSFVSNPFGATATTYGLLDDLRPDPLTDCEVPLALMYWTQAGVQFVDAWAVRRRITAPAPSGFGWPWLADRQRAEGEAMFYQFQDHIQAMQRDVGNAQAAVAAEWLRYLPPVGLLPVGGMKFQSGWNYGLFFSGKTYREPTYIEGAQISSLLHESLRYPPVDLNNDEMVWLYRVRENIEQIDQSAFRAPQGYLVFATGHMPFRGGARFDVNRWDYANNL